MIRLNKYLAQCGLESRRKCDLLIQSGQIIVNGQIITRLGYLINEDKDQVIYKDNLLSIDKSKVYILLNKPVGYVTTLRDEKGRKMVTDLVQINQRVFPVGRLDKNTEGLLLLTNDGNLCYQLTHPKFLVEKVYQVTINRKLKPDDLKKLQRGLMLETGITSPSKIKFLKSRQILEITIYEGKKRQIRKMFQTLGYSVSQLIRIKFANLKLNNLPVGKWRFLTAIEIRKIKGDYFNRL